METDTSDTTEKNAFLTHSIDKLKDICKMLNSTIEDLVKQMEIAKSVESKESETTEESDNAFNKGDTNRVFDKAYSRLSVTCNLSIEAITEVSTDLKKEYSKWKTNVSNESNVEKEPDANAEQEDENKAELKLRLVPIEKLMDPKLVNSKSSSGNKINPVKYLREKEKKKRDEILNARPVRTCTKNIPTICLDDSSESESSIDEIISRKTVKIRTTIETSANSKNNKNMTNGIKYLTETDLRQLIKPFNIHVKPLLLNHIETVVKINKLELVQNHLMDIMLQEANSPEKSKDNANSESKSKNNNNSKIKSNEETESKNKKANDVAKKKLLANLDASSDSSEHQNSSDNASYASEKNPCDKKVERNDKV